ncbi:hypothetical protein FM21_28170 [Streptomyces mutabilis]|uniref:Uncharacterized protein n=1 Tax=Streptomyces mutabilis TaxID=67332 RepID=A0A086N0E0_9ACTN|nr:hypothetical protein FM21_28170 [Streptomyces mutabilis]
MPARLDGGVGQRRRFESVSVVGDVQDGLVVEEGEGQGGQSPQGRIPGTLFLGGGVPVTSGKAPIAGIGVAGAPSGALDEKYAQAGAAALN